MNRDLLDYLHDHLAGATFAVSLLKQLRELNTESAVANLAAELLPQIEADRETLRRIIEACGGDHHSVKDVASWVAQKASRFKLDLKTPLGIFEAAEFLCLGVLGKLALWSALKESATRAPVDLERLIARAREQHGVLDSIRLLLARSLLAGWDAGSHDAAP